MQRLLVLGGGTAGTMVVNKLRRKLDRDRWQITVVDQDDNHLYQPGFLFIPFGVYAPAEVQRSRHRYIPDGVELVLGEIDRVDADANKVLLTDGRELGYDYLVIATGTTPRPDQTPDMLGSQWRKSIFDFYSLDGATALTGALAAFDGGRVVVHVTDMPIKCPVAPLEFTFLAEAYFRSRDMRDRVELTYVTPLPGAFTKPIASQHLGSMLTERKVEVEPDFMVERIDDEIKYVPVDKHTLLSKAHDNIFAVGDASNIPTSKAGSVAHFGVDVFTGNFCQHVAGKPMTGRFDGHANCFIESGDSKGLLIDFNYDTEPLTGSFPVPVLGPFGLLKENTRNHWGKLAFRWMYWHLLLPGRPIPIPAHMSMAGKHQPAAAQAT